MGYRIGSFNCFNFGMGYNKNIQMIADIIRQEQFDIVALQEIKRQEAVDMVLHHLPPCWTGKADEEVRDYAFIWNTRRIDLVTVTTENSKRTAFPHIYKQYRLDRARGQKDLIREPYFARFTPAGKAGGTSFEIRIINAHIRFSRTAADKRDEASVADTLSAIKMRENEFDVLAQTIYLKESDKRYGNFMPAYTILLGDFNLNLKESGASYPYLEEEIEIFENGVIKKLIATKQADLTTLKSLDTDTEEASPFASNYDHFTYDVMRFDGVQAPCGRVDAVQKYYDGDAKKYRAEVSDHVPVAMELRLRK